MFLLLLLFGCHVHYNKQSENFTHFPFNTTAESHKAGDSVVELYRKQLMGEMNRVIANSTTALTKEKYPGTLGNFVCDALMQQARKTFTNKTAVVALVNNGGLRAGLPAGEITVGNVFEVMPFDNKLVLLKISGKKLISGIQNMVRKKHAYSGLEVVLKNDSVVQCYLREKDIDPEGSYYLVTSDYLANGGDSFTFLNNPLERFDSEVLVRDAIINHCEQFGKNKQLIIPYTDERLIITK
ncbi:MAG: 5'-nucleotidase C-terminal domain-containing protein [Bacteroidia bacterium]|nr:5'-nucleotidase C-terminal domain-containing protein [Bacteroidia bacterium]